MRNNNFLLTLVMYLFAFYLFGNQGFAQVVLFSDDFESGLSKWTLTGSFGTSTTEYYSASNSLTDSPNGNYSDRQTIIARITNPLDLSSYLGAEITFYGKYTIEDAFDFMYLEVSNDGGNSFQIIDEFTGSQSSWQQYSYNLGAFAGYSNVILRFRLTSDHYVNKDGMYIDDIVITGSSADNAAPLIVTQEPEHYEGVQSDYTFLASISDVSGISDAKVYYYVDSNGPYISNSTHLGGDQYQFTIPAQPVGTNVKYKIEAIDNSVNQNKTDTSKVEFCRYISGTYLKYDDGVVDAVKTITGTQKVAVKISVPEEEQATLKTILVRNYRDANHVNDKMEIHVWENNNGIPGNDLISPILVDAEATLDNPFPFTRVDLRPYSAQLSGLIGDFFVGFTVPQNSAHLILSNNSNNRSLDFDGTSWSASTKDYEIRAIVEVSSSPLPVELTTFSAQEINGNVLLNWETATEINNYGFEIERFKFDNMSEENKFNYERDWETIAFIEGYGNSNSPKYYEYKDNSVIGGKYVYRLKQIDIDGKFSYSDEVNVNVELPDRLELIQNYPNPFNPSTKIKFSIKENSHVKLVVYDALGRKVSELVNEIKQPGQYQVNFDGSQLSSGIYFYSLTTSGKTFTKKMLLNK